MNFTLEQQLGSHQSLTASYVDALGRRLIGVLGYPPNRTNPSVLGNGTVGDTLYIIGNYSSSPYQALQTKFQRQFARGLGAVASYTWSYSIDNGSLSANLPVQAVSTPANAKGPMGLNTACNCATLNSPSFNISSSMANSTLGSAFSSGAGFNPIYNTGGPRNFQFAMKVFF